MTRQRHLIQAARFSPDGKRLLTGSLEGVLAEWDVESKQRLRILLDPAQTEATSRRMRLSEDIRGASIMSICYYPDGIRFVAAAANGKVVSWDAGNGGGAIHSWRAHDTSVIVVEISPDGKWLATGCKETGATTLRVWRVAEAWTTPPAEAFSSDRMIGGVFSLSFSSDNRFLATGGWGYSGYSAPMIYDLQTGERVNVLPFDASRAICFSPDGKLLATGDEFGLVSIWNLEQRKRIVEKKGHGRIVSVVKFSPDGRQLVSGSCDGGLKIWDVATGDLREEHSYDGLVLSCRFSPDSRSLSIAVGCEGADNPGIHQVPLS